jgi:pyruvate/2-oxoglutarate dehydrogenase complex dihydrolipoamide acyltransferase (E2) component
MPDFASLKTGVVNFFAGLGLIPTLVLIGLALILIWFAVSGVSDWFYGRQSDAEIERYKSEAADARVEAEAWRAEAERYKGAAAVYKGQAAQVDAELKELYAIRPEIKKQVEAAQARIEDIRNRPTVPVTENMRERIDAFGSKLDTLYP